MRKLIYLLVMVILLSGCSTALITPSLEKQVDGLKEHLAYNRQITQEFLDSLKRGMSEEETYSLLKPLMDEGIAYVRRETKDASESGELEHFEIVFIYAKDMLLTFLNNALDSWTIY